MKSLFIDLCYPRRSKDRQQELAKLLTNAVPRTVSGAVAYPYWYDGYGNLFVKIGEPDIAFTSHLDNVDYSKEDFNLLDVRNGFVHVADNSPSTCLGADDAAGIYIMVHMLRSHVQGLYCFFMDEEVGCKGSQWSAKNTPKLYENIDHMVSFDRMGYSSVITHQANGQTASLEFAEELCKRINNQDVVSFNEPLSFKPDDGGIYTDSNSFSSLIPNCTNLSVGYFYQHTKNEYQDLWWLEKIVKVYCQPSLWENLPIGEIVEEVYHYEDFDVYDYLDEHIDRMYKLPSTNMELFLEELDLLITDYETVMDDDVSDPFYFNETSSKGARYLDAYV